MKREVHETRLVAVLQLALIGFLCQPLSAQRILHRFDSLLSVKYNRGNIDTAYVVRPQTKWTVTARLNVSGAKIESEGMENVQQHFHFFPAETEI